MLPDPPSVLAWVPLPAVGPEFYPGLLAGATFLGLAVLLLALDFNRRLYRAFALFMVLRGLLNLIGPYRNDPATAAFWGACYPYFAISVPIAALYFAVVYRDPDGASRGHTLAARGLLVLGLAGVLAYAADHTLWVPLNAPMLGLEPLRLLSYLVVALVVALDYARSRPGPRRAGLLLVAVSFGLYPLTYLVNRVPAYDQVLYLELGLSAALLAVFARLSVRASDPDLAAGSRKALVVLGLAGVVGLAAGLVTRAGNPLGFQVAFYAEGLTTLAQPVLVTYALVRHELFGIDLRIKGTIRQGTIVGAFVGVYLVSAQGAQLLLGNVAPYVGIAVAGLLGMFMGPLQRTADRIANTAMPNVSDTPGYLSIRKLEMYRSALEDALSAGGAGAANPRLAALRAQLGLTERDHAVLLHAMRVEGEAAPVASLAPGEVVLGRYRVTRFLGEGAHGRTYLARDEPAGREVVVKAIRPDRGGDATVRREAEAMGAIHHPNVVRFLAVEPARGEVYIVMEYVDGGSLRERLERGRLDARAFLRLARGLLGGLGAVHAARLVHRDVKPSNVLLTRGGDAKLADFGVAHLPGVETTIGPGHSGTAIGTIRYMSPEQAKGRKVTPRSDLFSAAATLYEAWTGSPYLPADPRESPIELQMRAASAAGFDRPFDGPPVLRAWFTRALDPDPAARFSSAEAMLAALEDAIPPVAAGGPLAAEETS
jgi:protein kinase-like protein